MLDTGTGPRTIGGARLRALLARLVLDAGHAVRPQALVEALWADTPPADELNALQSLVSRLRRELGDPALLTSDAAGYRLAVDAEAVDAVRFERLARSGRQLSAQGRPAEAGAALREALGLWRGPALADVRAAPFADGEAARLDRARTAALEDRIEADLALGADPDLVAELEALAAEHPLRERLHAQLVRALAAAGRGAEALAAHQRVRERLAEAFGTDPGPLLQAAHLAVLRGEVAPPPPRPQAHGNLGAPTTSFVGRDDDVRRVVGLLGTARLVTLVGPGGAGKIRLATTSGRELTPAAGVWLVALAPVAAADVPRAVVDVVRRRAPERGAPPEDIVDQLVEILAGDELVLVLDNCEHVIDAAAQLAAALLSRCPGLRVLATSREPLRIDGETLHPVLPLPPTDAVTLFRDRAAAAHPGVDLDGATLAAAPEICRRLDGLPLAIELAAACLRTLPIDVVAARLDDRFRLLTGGNRTALPRHRTLHAVVAWSWDLLEPDERALLERLSVVPDSVSEDAAEALNGLDAPTTDVRELLMALADKSLLHPAGAAAGEPRYRMLETIRQFGQEQLAARGQVDATRTRHGAFLLALVEAADPQLRTRDQLRWLARLAAERDNLLAAIRWAIGSGDTATAFRFGVAMCWFWDLRGNPPEAQDLLGRIVALPGPADPVARAVVVAAHALGTGAPGAAQEHAAVFARMARAVEGIDHGLHPALDQARFVVAITTVRDGATDPAEPIGPIGPIEPNEPWLRSYRLLLQGQLGMLTGGPIGDAEDNLARALAGFEELGERWGVATALSTLAGLRRRCGDLDAELALNARASRCFRELGMAEHSIENEVQAALIRARAGGVDTARRTLTGLLDRVRGAEPAGQVRLGLARLEWRAGRAAQAREQACAGLADDASDRRAPAYLAALLLGVLAQVDAACGASDDALRRLDHPAVHLVLTWNTPVAADLAVVVAGIELSRDRPGSAGRLLGIATTLRGSEGLADPDVAMLVGRANAALGPTGFAAAHAAGAALGRREARARVSTIITAPR